MDTISHGTWTYLITYRHPKTWFVLIGAMFPDVSVIGIAIIMLLQGKLSLTPPWLPQLYMWRFTPLIDSFFHSIVFWTIALGLSILFKWDNLRWFVFGVFFHIGIDVVTHKQFLPEYFFPFSRYTVKGIVDYRTLRFTAADIILLLACFCVYVWTRWLNNRKI